MPNVVVITRDDRVRRQVEQLLGELDFDDLRHATFKNVEEFEELYYKDPTQVSTPPPEETDKEKKEEDEGPADMDLRLFSEVHMIIYALDTVGPKPNLWIEKARKNMIKYKHVPENGQQRWVMLKYEDDGINKLDLMHPAIDDLIYLPIDRLIFLQKIEIFLNLPQRTTPKYLFTQEVKYPIEISKITRLDRLSDVALAIRNPLPIKKGVPGHFYIQLPGEKEILETWGKVLRSEPHPEHKGQFLVYFTFFALKKNDLSQIRRSLSKSTRYQSLIADDRNNFKFDPDDWRLSENDKKTFGLAVIDSDEANGNTIAQQIQKDMDRVQVIAESSYSLFLHKYFKTGGPDGDRSPPKQTEATDFYAQPLSFLIGSDLKCTAVSPPPKDGDLYLGHPATELVKEPMKWLHTLDQESQLIVEEAVALARTGRVIKKLISINNLKAEKCAVTFIIYRDTNPEHIKVEVTPATLSDIVERMNSESKNARLDGMIVDTSFVPEEPMGWIQGLRDRGKQVGLVPSDSQLNFFLITDNENKIHQPLLNCPDILCLMPKPIDSRQLMFLLSETFSNKNTLFHFENLGWTEPGMPVHISKEVELEALSEYGATLKTKQKMVPGTMIYLRKSIYDSAPNRCLSARVYACEEHPNEKDHFQIYATYFGITDAFLKFARTWIRENYAQQKNQGA